MKIFIIKSISLMLIFNILLSIFIPLNIHGAQDDTQIEQVSTLKERQQAIIDVAYAYYIQKAGIQYDQNRRFLDVKPEEAKDQWPIYLDCSSFVFNVYRQAFITKERNPLILQQRDTTKEFLLKNAKAEESLNKTSKLLDEAKSERYTKSIKANKIYTKVGENIYIPCYVDRNAEGNVDKSFKNITPDELTNLKSLLQIGDLIVYENTKKDGGIHGHVFLYLGNENLIHCTGSKYDSDKLEDKREKSSIKIETLDDTILNSDSKRYLLRDNILRFAVLRPLNAKYIRDSELSEYAKVKSALPELDIVMTSSPGNLKTVNPGSTITYSIYVKNKGNTKVEDFYIRENISEYLTISNIPTIELLNGKEVEKKLSNTVLSSKNNNLIYCHIFNLSANKTIKITYKATINKDVLPGTEIISQSQIGKKIDAEIYYEGTNTIMLTVGNTLTKNQQTTLANTVNSIDIMDKTYLKTRDLIDAVYSKAFYENSQVNLGFKNTTVKNMLSQIMTTEIIDDNDTNKVKITFKSSNDPDPNNFNAQKALVNGFYGKRYAATIGTRYLTTSNLISGDIIIYSNDVEYVHEKKSSTDNDPTLKYYIYLYISDDSGDKLMTINSSGKVVSICNNDDPDKVQNILDKIIGCDQFAVLRPSLTLDI